MTTFTVVRDGIEWIVADASFGPKSAALVPVDHQWGFINRKAALEQAKSLTAFARDGREIKTMMIETPDRFELVADTLYGPAWE